jgi:hypothetical protein
MSGAGSYKDEPGYEYHENKAYLSYTFDDFKNKPNMKELIQKALNDVKAADACSQKKFDDKMAKLDEEFMPDITRNQEVINFTRQACVSIKKDPAVLKRGHTLTQMHDWVQMLSSFLDEAKDGGMPEKLVEEYTEFLHRHFIPACQEFDPHIHP